MHIGCFFWAVEVEASDEIRVNYQLLGALGMQIALYALTHIKSEGEFFKVGGQKWLQVVRLLYFQAQFF